MDDCGCDELARLSRRGLLRGAVAVGGAAAVFGSTVVTRAPSFAAPGDEWCLVVLSLRGAADGLSMVVPHGDPVYYQARPRIAVPADRLVATDAMFGLHPALGALEPLWTAGRLAAVHATGLPVANRSHFSAMEQVEDAAPGSDSRSGWLNRLLGTDGTGTALEGVAVGSLPSSMFGPQPVLAVSRVDEVEVAGARTLDATDPRLRSLRRAWRDEDSEMGRAMRAAIDTVRGFQPAHATEDPSARYPDSDLGRALADVARVVRGGVGAHVFTVDHGDWDMHVGLGRPDSGWMYDNNTALAEAVAAFFTDLGALGDKVTLVTISEFGRRTVENSAQGLDHGWGNVMLLAGAGVRGGRYYGSWPGLTLGGDGDLAVTTDYRSVLAEVVTARTGRSVADVFPGFAPEPVGAVAATG